MGARVVREAEEEAKPARQKLRAVGRLRVVRVKGSLEGEIGR